MTPKNDRCQIAASPEITSQYGELGFERLYHQFSLHHLYVLCLKGWENVRLSSCTPAAPEVIEMRPCFPRHGLALSFKMAHFFLFATLLPACFPVNGFRYATRLLDEAKECGKKQPFSIHTTSNTLYIHFTSGNLTDQHRGFAAGYVAYEIGRFNLSMTRKVPRKYGINSPGFWERPYSSLG